MTSNALARQQAAAPVQTLQQVPAFDVQVRTVIRKSIAVDITSDAHFAAFIAFCEAAKLDPRAKEIYGWTDRKNNRLVVAISIEGYRKLARRRAKIIGIEHLFLDQNGNWRDAWPFRELPVACRCLIYVDGIQRPFRKDVYYKEFAVDANPNWKQRPLHMLQVRAEAHALRLLPDVADGLPADMVEILEGAEVLDDAPTVTVTAPIPPQIPTGPQSVSDADQCPHCHAPEGKPHTSRCPDRQTAAGDPAPPDERRARKEAFERLFAAYQSAGGPDDDELMRRFLGQILTMALGEPVRILSRSAMTVEWINICADHIFESGLPPLVDEDPFADQ